MQFIKSSVILLLSIPYANGFWETTEPLIMHKEIYVHRSVVRDSKLVVTLFDVYKNYIHMASK